MNYSFEYIDIILLAMIAGFIFLRLRGILGRRSGFEGKPATQFEKILKDVQKENQPKPRENFDDVAQKEFITGAKIAYETIITSFSSGNLKSVKQLLDSKVYEQFDEAIKARNESGQVSETTFIGISSAEIKNHENKKGFLEVTVSFVSEIISCVKDKDNKILSGDPKKIKKVFDTWTFSKEINSTNPNWLLVSTEA